jgi:hypothetical protein
MKTKFPYLLSSTSYFLNGMKQICLDFLTILMYKDKYKIELGDKGMTIKVSMKIPPRFVGYQRLITELDQSKVVQDCDTTVSAQQETSSLVCAHYGGGTKIWSPPFVIPLPFSCENGFKMKQLWADGCDDLYAHMSALANVRQCPANNVHQLNCYLRVILTGSEKAHKQSHRIANQFLVSPGRASGLGCGIGGGGGRGGGGGGGGSGGGGGGGRQGQNPLPDHHDLLPQIPPHNPPNPPAPAQVIDNLQLVLVPAGLVVEAEEHQMHMRRLMQDRENGSPKPCNHDI